MRHHDNEPEIFGLAAEFDDPDALLSAAVAAREAGYRKMDAYTPFPVHGLADALKFDDWRLPWVIFLAGVGGTATGFGFQIYTQLDYPWNVGGRPLISWPAYIPIAYECTILFAAGAAVVFMILLNGLPRPHHPVFNTPRFDRASQDRFFLTVEATDPKFDREATAQFLTTLGPQYVSEISND